MAQWNELPLEVLKMIIERSTKNTRNAIGACSFANLVAVQSTELEIIPEVYIYNEKEEWEINPESRYGERNTMSFERMQEEVTSFLNKAHSVKDLHITIKSNPGVRLNLMNDKNQKCRVENLKFDVEDGDLLKSLLSQIEPVYLRKVSIWDDGGNVKIYDMPQLIFAEEVWVTRPSVIREKQLLKLNARFVYFDGLPYSPRRYIEKCASHASKVLPHFQFKTFKRSPDYESVYLDGSRELILDTDSPDIKLRIGFCDRSHKLSEIYDLEGFLMFQTQRSTSNYLRNYPSALRRIERLRVIYERQTRVWQFNIDRKFDDRKTFHTRTDAGAQDLLDDILGNIDYIHNFTIGIPPKMIWRPRTSKLVVGELNVGAQSFSKIDGLLQQIDPAYLKILHITMQDEIGEDMFDLPHIYYPENLQITREENFRGCLNETCIKEDGLYLKPSNEEGRDQLSTEKGINRYLKETLSKLDQKPYQFEFDDRIHYKSSFDWPTVLEGLNVIETRKDKWNVVYHYLDSPHTEYILELMQKDGTKLIGRRKKWQDVRNEATVVIG